MSMMDDGNVNEVPHNRREAELTGTTMRWRMDLSNERSICKMNMNRENMQEMEITRYL